MNKFIKVTTAATDTLTHVNVDQIVRFNAHYQDDTLTVITFVGSGHREDNNYIIVRESPSEVWELIAWGSKV